MHKGGPTVDDTNGSVGHLSGGSTFSPVTNRHCFISISHVILFARVRMLLLSTAVLEHEMSAC